MKKNIIKFLVLILLIGGLFVVTGCNSGANQFDDPEDPVEPSDPVDPSDPAGPSDPEYHSKGFTIYELEDSKGNLLDGYAVGKYEGSDTEVIIPSTWNGKPVIKISNNTFAGNTKITKVSVPASVKLIGIKAFADCTNLKEVVYGEGSQLQSISKEAFKGCTALSYITIPEGVQIIGDSAFYQCASVGELYVPSTVYRIGEAAFGAMIGLQKLTVPFIGGGDNDDVDKDVLGYVFGKTYFLNTTPANQKYEIKAGEKGSRTYYIPTSLVEVELLATSNKSIPFGAFSGITTIDFITIPVTIERIGDSAFLDCTGLDSIYYSGTKEQWAKIVGVSTDPDNEEVLSNINIVYNHK